MKGSKQFLAEAKLFLMQFLVSWSIVCAFYCFSLCWLHDPQLKWKSRIPFFSPLWANDLNMESYTGRTMWKVQMHTCSFTDAAIRLAALLSIKPTNRFYMMLLWVCTVIDHRWLENEVRTEKWQIRRSRVCHWCSHNILSFLWSITVQIHGNMKSVCFI